MTEAQFRLKNLLEVDLTEEQASKIFTAMKLMSRTSSETANKLGAYQRVMTQAGAILSARINTTMVPEGSNLNINPDFKEGIMFAMDTIDEQMKKQGLIVG